MLPVCVYKCNFLLPLIIAYFLLELVIRRQCIRLKGFLVLLKRMRSKFFLVAIKTAVAVFIHGGPTMD